MRLLLLIVFALSSLCFFTPSVVAATFEVEVIDLRPIREPTMHVTISGEISTGDAVVLSGLLAKNMHEETRDVSFMFDSPGGNLLEGLAIGRLIAALPVITTAQVGSTDQPNAICASACVLSFLGADYRYLGKTGRIGVHQFGAPNADLDAAEALSIGQELSATLTEYIRSQRADPAFYERMTKTSFEGIDWVERETLEEWRVITGPIYDEWTEYKNVNGSVALQISQSSLFGDNSVTLLCGNSGLVGVALLNKPSLAMYGRMDLAVDGVALEIPDFEIVSDTENFVRAVFKIPAIYTPQLSNAQSFGVRIVQPSENTFFGFEMRLPDEKFSEMLDTCQPAKVKPAPKITNKPVIGIDYPGGDMSSSGVRGVRLKECIRICRSNKNCLAVSYVPKSRWCWPKAKLSDPVVRSGVISWLK